MRGVARLSFTARIVSLTRDVGDARLVHLVYLVDLVCLVDPQVRASKDGDARQARRAGRVTRGLNSTLEPHPHSARRLVRSPLRVSNEGWFIWSISSIWLVGPEIHPEEPDRPERPAPDRRTRARCASRRTTRLPILFLFVTRFGCISIMRSLWRLSILPRRNNHWSCRIVPSWLPRSRRGFLLRDNSRHSHR